MATNGSARNSTHKKPNGYSAPANDADFTLPETIFDLSDDEPHDHGDVAKPKRKSILKTPLTNRGINDLLENVASSSKKTQFSNDIEERFLPQLNFSSNESSSEEEQEDKTPKRPITSTPVTSSVHVNIKKKLSLSFSSSKELALSPALPPGDYCFYLIKKPAEVSLDDLAQLPLKPEPSDLKPKKLKIKNGRFTCEILPSGPQMLYVTQASATQDLGKTFFPISGRIEQTLFVSAKLSTEGLGPLEDFQNEPLPYVQSIKREPTREGFDDLQERLVAFGVKSKKRRSLPGLRVKKVKLEPAEMS